MSLALAPKLTTLPQSIDGVPVEAIEKPTSILDLCTLLRDCNQSGRAVFPAGGGTSLDIGLPPSRPGLLLDTSGLTAIDDYPSEDMTITVEAGIRIADLAKVLAAKGQTCPVDCADPEQATLGGALATATSGPRRYGYGTPRDYVIGIDVIHADGTRVHGGGRVVKNVAGYDFMKLHTGAFGSLGVIAQVTLKLKPLPESKAAVTCTIDPEQIEPVLAQLNRSDIRPVGIELLGGKSASLLDKLLSTTSTDWRLVLLFEESAPAVNWQIERCASELKINGASDVQAVADERYAEVLVALVQWQAHAPGAVMFKANMLPGKVVEFSQFARQQIPDDSLLSHAGSGILWGALSGKDFAAVIRGLESLRRLVNAQGGNLMIPRCPTERKGELALWGTPHGDWPIMAKLKEKLDPAGILNPGRMFA